MARYDAGMTRDPAGGPGRGGEGAQRGHGERNDWASADAGTGVYGPARYGLGPYHQRLRSRRRPDDELKAEVLDALFYDTWVDAEAIDVQVRDGVVTLRGELPSYDEIRFATDDTWDVDGVVGVRSELRVREAR